MKGIEEQEEELLAEKQLVEEISATVTLLIIGCIKLYKILDIHIIRKIKQKD